MFVIISSLIGARLFYANVIEGHNPIMDKLPIEELSTAGVSLTYLFTMWKDFTLLLRDIKNYVFDSESNFDYLKELLELFLQLFFITLMILLFKSELPVSKETKQSFTWETVYLKEKPNNAENLATFPLVFENATLKDENLVSGFLLDSNHKTQLNQFIKAITPCSEEDNLVSFSIKGFSSSKSFDGALPAKFDSLNIALTNLRVISINNYIIMYP